MAAAVVIPLAGLVVAVLCTWGFVGSTARADARLRERDVVGTARCRGAARAWMVTALVFVAASVLWIALVVAAR